MKLNKDIIEQNTALHSHLKFDVTEDEHEILERIVHRAQTLHMKHAGKSLPWLDVYMDLVACHRNGTPLKLEALYEADDFNFVHDVFGIIDHMDRKTGTLTRCFLPRFYDSEAVNENETIEGDN